MWHFSFSCDHFNRKKKSLQPRVKPRWSCETAFSRNNFPKKFPYFSQVYSKEEIPDHRVSTIRFGRNISSRPPPIDPLLHLEPCQKRWGPLYICILEIPFEPRYSCISCEWSAGEPIFTCLRKVKRPEFFYSKGSIQC